LFLLCFLLNLFIFLLSWISNLDIHYIKDIPPYTQGMILCSFFEYLGISLFGIVVTLLFISYNLIFLASASFIMFLVFLTLSYFYINKPQKEIRKKQSNQ
jgi:L-asparagine transporter-like permease